MPVPPWNHLSHSEKRNENQIKLETARRVIEITVPCVESQSTLSYSVWITGAFPKFIPGSKGCARAKCHSQSVLIQPLPQPALQRPFKKTDLKTSPARLYLTIYKWSWAWCVRFYIWQRGALQIDCGQFVKQTNTLEVDNVPLSYPTAV